MMMGSIRPDKVPEGIKSIFDTEHPPGMASRDNAALKAQGEDGSRLHLIVDINRIGAKLFNVKMEYTYFAPRSGKNYLFEMVIIKWPHLKNMPPPFVWTVCSFPIEFKPQAEAVAKECGLRLADGIPTVFDGEGAHHFPMNGPTVFTLENVTGHRVYNNDPGEADRLRKEEDAACDAIINADRKKLREEMREAGYADDQITRILKHWEEGNEAYDEAPSNAKDGQHRHGGY